jgi:DNA-binding MarR family transcriptional regulator
MSKNRRQLGSLHELVEIDRLVHEPARLMILMHLYVIEEADFVFLLNATQLTWGNLSAHVSRLEEAGYVDVQKEFVGKKPRTTVRLTAAGRQAIDTYSQTMQQALQNLKE